MNTEQESSREDLIAAASEELEAVKEEYQAASQNEPPARIRPLRVRITELGSALSELISKGAGPCPSCGVAPQGILQNVLVNREPHPAYEVGCTNCRDHHAVGLTAAEAVRRWNTGPGAKGWKRPTDGTKLMLEGGVVYRYSADDSKKTSCKIEPPPGGTLGG